MLPMHVGKDINVPLVEQVVLPLPVNPRSHVTTTVCPVVPVILSAVALLELTTSVAVQELAVQVNVLNWPFVPQVTVPLPEYPVLQVTVVVWPVVPVWNMMDKKRRIKDVYWNMLEETWKKLKKS